MATAFVLIKVVATKQKTVAEEVRKLEGVEKVELIGDDEPRYDMVAKVVAGSSSELKLMMLGRFRKVTHIKETETLLVID